jgi:hypothetical protein
MTAGYSGTPLWKKLGFVDGQKVAVLNEPKHYGQLLDGHPPGVTFSKSVKGADAIHLFLTEARELRVIPGYAEMIPPITMLWVSWPKKTSPLSKGLSEDDIRAAALSCGLVDIKVCAVDQDWSGLKLTRRKS